MLACVLFKPGSRAREICEEMVREMLDTGEFLVNRDVYRRSVVGYVIRRLAEEGLVTVHKKKNENVIRVTLSDTLKHDIMEACTKLIRHDPLVQALLGQRESDGD